MSLAFVTGSGAMKTLPQRQLYWLRYLCYFMQQGIVYTRCGTKHHSKWLSHMVMAFGILFHTAWPALFQVMGWWLFVCVCVWGGGGGVTEQWRWTKATFNAQGPLRRLDHLRPPQTHTHIPLPPSMYVSNPPNFSKQREVKSPLPLKCVMKLQWRGQILLWPLKLFERVLPHI